MQAYCSPGLKAAVIWVFVIPTLGMCGQGGKDRNRIIKLLVSLYIHVWECTFITSQDRGLKNTLQELLVERGVLCLGRRLLWTPAKGTSRTEGVRGVLLCGPRQVPTFSELLRGERFPSSSITSEWNSGSLCLLFLCSLPSPPGPSRHLSATTLTLECPRHCPRGRWEPQHSKAASGPTCHFVLALLLSQSHLLGQRKPGRDEI